MGSSNETKQATIKDHSPIVMHQHDYDELLLLSGDANHAKEVAVQELDRVRSSYLDAKGRRERELGERQELVQAKTDMAQRMENREKLRQDIIAKAAGDLGQEEEEALKKTLAVNKMNQSKIEEESKVHKKKIDKFEGAFRKIKEATGVSDVNEVIQKIVSQEDTQNNLMELTRENQAKIEQLQDEKSAVCWRLSHAQMQAPHSSSASVRDRIAQAKAGGDQVQRNNAREPSQEGRR